MLVTIGSTVGFVAAASSLLATPHRGLSLALRTVCVVFYFHTDALNVSTKLCMMPEAYAAEHHNRAWQHKWVICMGVFVVLVDVVRHSFVLNASVLSLAS